jgi:hypothetical protein
MSTLTKEKFLQSLKRVSTEPKSDAEENITEEYKPIEHRKGHLKERNSAKVEIKTNRGENDSDDEPRVKFINSFPLPITNFF